MKSYNEKIEVNSGHGISIHNITPEINFVVSRSGISNGFVIITSQHTTTAIGINEYEERLLDDIQQFLTGLIPPGNAYLHNDIHLRDCPPDEPENAHSHLAAILLDSSETVSLHDAKLMLGRYQSVLMFELDGPRVREVNIQVIGE